MIDYTNSTKDLTESGTDTAIISVGSTEQCGPCLPLHLDTLCAEYYARAFGEALNAYVLPPFPFTTAEEHSSFRGTITLRPITMMRMLEEVVAVLREQGFRKQALLVTHGGAKWADAFVKDMNWKYKDIIVINALSGSSNIRRQAIEHAGFTDRTEMHGGAISRAMAMFLAPDCVSPGEFGRKVPASMFPYKGYVTWDRITPDGSWGRYTEEEAGLATAEAGRALMQYFVTHYTPVLVKHMEEACRLKGICP